MKIVQTFWTGSTSGIKLSEIGGGWLSPEYHWMSWALSCLQAARFFDRVELVTDNKGKELLIDMMALPYTNISTTLEEGLQEAPPELFSLAKLFTYRQQTEPFLHIDGDVFLFQKPSAEWLTSPVLAQNIDRNLLFYKQTLDKINEYFSFVPPCMKTEYYEAGDIEAANAGVFGGSDLDFIREYCIAGFEFIGRNRQDIGKFPAPNLNFIFEQYLLFCKAKEESVDIAYLIPDVVESLWYQQFVRFQDLPCIPVAHPVGGFKKSLLICNHVARNLRYAYPDYYYKILLLIREEGEVMHNRIYQQEGFIEAAEKISAGRELTAGDMASIQWRVQENGILLAQPDNSFQRTREAILYFAESGLLPSEFKSRIENQDAESFLQPDVFNGIDDGRVKEILTEVSLFDQQKKHVILDSFSQLSSVIALYKKDVQNYTRTQQVFALPDEQLSVIKVCLSNNVSIVDLRWELPFETVPRFRALLQTSTQEEESFRQVALIPDIFRLQVEEYFFDTLDSIVAGSCSEAVCVQDVISAAAEFFDAEEIRSNPGNFKNLIISVLKRLCYANVLHIA